MPTDEPVASRINLIFSDMIRSYYANRKYSADCAFMWRYIGMARYLRPAICLERGGRPQPARSDSLFDRFLASRLQMLQRSDPALNPCRLWCAWFRKRARWNLRAAAGACRFWPDFPQPE